MQNEIISCSAWKGIKQRRRPPTAFERRRHERSKKMAKFIKPVSLSVGYIWHSPKKRSVQTAQLLGEAIKVQNRMLERQGISPNDDVGKLASEISSAEQEIMLVGHLPFLSKLASKLLCGSESANTISFKNAGIVCLERTEVENWQVNWTVIPELVA
ncbi:phosphohistidine phosphatase SixA [Planctomycetota bacterium]